jgi:hypothetical protein
MSFSSKTSSSFRISSRFFLTACKLGKSYSASDSFNHSSNTVLFLKSSFPSIKALIAFTISDLLKLVITFVSSLSVFISPGLV